MLARNLEEGVGIEWKGELDWAELPTERRMWAEW